MGAGAVVLWAGRGGGELGLRSAAGLGEAGLGDALPRRGIFLQVCH